MMDCIYDPDPDIAYLKKIGGPALIVEGDEALISKGHGLLAHGNNNKTMRIWVVGLAERA